MSEHGAFLWEILSGIAFESAGNLFRLHHVHIRKLAGNLIDGPGFLLVMRRGLEVVGMQTDEQLRRRFERLPAGHFCQQFY